MKVGDLVYITWKDRDYAVKPRFWGRDGEGDKELPHGSPVIVLEMNATSARGLTMFGPTLLKFGWLTSQVPDPHWSAFRERMDWMK